MIGRTDARRFTFLDRVRDGCDRSAAPRALTRCVSLTHVGVAQGLGAALSIRAQTMSWLWLTGALGSLTIIATLLAALVVAARASWMKIAVRALAAGLRLSAC